MPLSEEVLEASQQVINSDGPDLTNALSSFIGRFVVSLKTGSGALLDGEGNRTEAYSVVIHSAPDVDDANGPPAFPADNVAAVVDVGESLDVTSLQAAYARITLAKGLRKSPARESKGKPRTTTTLGIIFARSASIPLEALAEELHRLNEQTPGNARPDMVVVASTGTINYAVQFPGEGVSGDFLPPAEGAAAAYTVPAYIVMIIRPTGAHTLNKMLAFLVAHLAIFSPEAALPSWGDMLKGVSPQAVTHLGYQYNQRGDLLQVPREFYNDRYLGPLPVRIEARDGDFLATLQFLPWQDGAAILLRGKLPLEGLLVFLGKEALARGGVVKLKSSQISYVLPIVEADFRQMLTRIQRQSNMIVRPDNTEWVVQKIADEGSRSPFMARLLLGLLRLRETIFADHAARALFDKTFEFITTALFSAREAMQRAVEVWKEYEGKVASGEIAHLQRQGIRIDASVDRELGQHVDAFLNASTRALKTGMQGVAAELQANIGFLFKKTAPFEAGVAALEASDPNLAEYLRETRSWSETLLNRRNAIEHEGWTLPRVTFERVSGGVRAIEPQIAGQPASAFLTFMFDRLTCFVEEVTAHLLQRRMPPGITITELPLASRLPEAPERFTLTISEGGMPPWSIAFHTSSFEET